MYTKTVLHCYPENKSEQRLSMWATDGIRKNILLINWYSTDGLEKMNISSIPGVDNTNY